MRTMVARLMPKASSPIKASPDSLSKMRLKAGLAEDMMDSLNINVDDEIVTEGMKGNQAAP